MARPSSIFAAACGLALAAALCGACDDSVPSGTDAAARNDGGALDASPDAPASSPDGATSQALTGCLETPGELPRPPAGRLPCDLVPPGLSL